VNATRTRAQARKKTLADNFRLCTADGIYAVPLVMMTLPVNVVLAALFTKAIPLTTAALGFITSLPFMCNFLQLAVSPLLARWFSAKKISIGTSACGTACWAAFAVMLSFLPGDNPEVAARWIAGWFFVTGFFSALTGVGWNAWVQEWVPVRLRGKYFGRRNRLLQVANMAFLLLAGWVLARWEYAIGAFQVVIVFGIGLRLLSLRAQWRMETLPRSRVVARTGSLRDQVWVLGQSRSFLLFILFGAVWSFAANVFGPFYHKFMLDRMGQSAFDIGLISTSGALGAALSMPAWGQLIDRFGNKSVMAVSLILWQVQNYLWCFLTPGMDAWLYGMWIWGGMTNSGFILGMFTLLLKLIPPGAKNLAIGANLALTSLVAAIAPILGGAALEWGLSREGADPLAVYHACFAVQPTIALAGALLLLRIEEPAAAAFSIVVGAMRNVRMLSGVFGFGPLVNHIFYKPRKPERK
jgi:MFS family permease